MTTTAATTTDALIERICSSRPDDPAVMSTTVTLTYTELLTRAHELAGTLRGAGVTTETPVAVAVPRSVEHVVATLAVWLAGGACVPIEPAQPERRIAQLLAVAGAGVLIDAAGTVHPLPDGRRPTAAGERTAESLAYVFFTSGSTGTPKAVAVPHSGILNEAVWTRDAFALGPGDRCGWASASVFALTRWAVWSPLVAGAAVAVAPDGVEWSAPRLRDWLVAAGVTWTVLVTSSGEQLLALPWPASSPLRSLVIGGEQLRSSARSAPFEVVNSYGITETCVRTAAWLPLADAEELPSIGRPVAQTTARVLDDAWRPVPPGEVGELFIGGAGLARGYLGSPGLTASRFVPDPDAAVPGARMYRTGDLVRMRPTGELEYVGRVAGDDKANGVRVNVAEVEAALLAQPAVADACVVVRPDGSGRARLVAYVVGEPGHPLDVRDIVDRLGERLPGAMIPDRYVRLAGVPRLVSGKADRARLPEPSASNELVSEPVAPSDEVEATVVAAFAETLGRADVGAHDDYLRLGGTSLGLFEVRELLSRRLGVLPSIAEIFEHRTAARLAGLLRDRPIRPDAVAPVARPAPTSAETRTVPLSHAQRRIWFVDGLRHRPTAHVELVTVEIGGAVDVEALRKALEALVDRHEVLRSTLAVQQDEPVSVVHPRWSPPLTVLAEPVTDGDVERRLVDTGLLAPFDLRQEPPVRFGLLSRRSGDYLLAVVVHHIAWDGGSAGILVTELSALYDQARSGEPAMLPKPASHTDHVSREQQDAATDEPRESDLYWLRQLHGVRPVTWRRAAVPNGAPPGAAVVELALPAGLPAALRELSALTGYTGTMLGAAVLAVAVRPLHTDDDVTVCVPVSTRDTRTRSTIGPFLNLVPLRIAVPPRTTWSALLAATKATCLEAWEHGDTPFERIAQAARLPGRAAGTDLSRVTFEHVRLPEPVRRPGAESPWRLRWHPGTEPKSDLFVGLIETVDELRLRVVYDPLVLRGDDVARCAADICELLQQAVADVDAPVPPPHEPSIATVAGTASDDVWSAAARAWSDALGVGEVRAGDSFFDLGGDEVSALRVAAMLTSALGTRVSLRAVFDSESFADFVRTVASPAASEDAVV